MGRPPKEMMMLGSDEKYFTVDTIKGGYLLKWRDDSLRKPIPQGWSQVKPEFQPPTTGREIFTSKSALLKRVKALL